MSQGKSRFGREEGPEKSWLRLDTSDPKQSLVFWEPGSLPFSNLMIKSQNFINVSKPKNSIEKYKAPALEKGLDILEFLADFPEGLSKVDIAKGLGRSLNEIFRMVSVLEKRGYILCDPETERYSLSLKLFPVANRYQPTRMLVKKSSFPDDEIDTGGRSILASFTTAKFWSLLRWMHPFTIPTTSK